MPATRNIVSLCVVLMALLACAGSATAAPASTPATDVLTICPTPGTAPVVTMAGERACVPNSCFAMAQAQTGSAAACEAATAPTTYLMSIDDPTVVPATADPITNSLARVLPATAPTNVQSVVIRSLIGFGIGALLLAGALMLRSRRMPRAIGTPDTLTRRPAESA